ncbi:hypothetical protein HIM_10530 [Hirsutella minnesotensis 3608]|uniref:Integrase catalytic domain-containing protein n=1 Tax=Hirsutella minnesotensis 3608 TaxID=1043627 RepID=A0A0F8A265_9HYPO|nr:hypothetical protein HIM_10530 [Hirsutella minnesotensis 3608]
MLIIKGSISPVQTTLEAAGWSRFTEKDPKVLYELIQRAIPKVSADATGDLVAEFGSISRKTFDSLMAYQTRIQYLKRRTKELNCGFDDKACLWFTIKGLREVYPQWYTFLERDMNKGTLTWENLMTEMYAEANKEKTAMALSTLSKNSNEASAPQRSSGPPAQSQKPQSEQTRRFCPTCNRSHWVGLPMCSFCRRHHQGGDAECFAKHPEKLEEFRRRRNRQTNVEPAREEVSINQNASQAAFTFNSGLIGMSITPEAAQPTKPSRAVQDALKSQTLTRDSIIDDSGASNHTFNDLKWFKDIKGLPQELSFTSANGGDLVAKAIGTAYIRAKRSDGLVTEMNLGRSVYCPTAPINLLSSGQLRADGAIRDGFKDCIIHKDSKTEMAMIDWINNVAVIRSETPTTRQQNQGNMLLAVSYQVMHERLMHASPEIVLKACEQAGIKISNREAKEHHCRTCHLAKSALIVSRTPPVRPARPLSLVRIDLIENKPLGHRQFRYTWHAVDAHCGYHWVRFLRHKDELFQATKDFDAYIQRTTGYQVQEYGMDNDVSFNWTTELIPWARANGISLKPTVPGTPRQNGLTERAGSKITQLARCIMIHSKLPEFLWPYAQESVVKVLNLLPCKSNQGLSPHEVFASFLRVNEELHKPYIRHLRTFGCVAYVHIKKERRVQARKMAPRAEEGKLVGWEGIHGKIYHIYVPARNRIVRACDVRFYEKLLQEPQKSASAEEVDTIEYEATLLDEVQEEEAGATIVERISDSLSTSEPGGGTTDKGPSIEETQDHHLPTPEITQELDESHDSSVNTPSDSEDSQEIDGLADERPIPPETSETYTTPVVSLPRPSRQNAERPAGYYQKLHRGNSGDQALALLPPDVVSPINRLETLCLTAMKAENLANSLQRPPVPKSYRKARVSPDWETKWKPAFDKQYKHLQDRSVWTLEELPHDAKLLPGKWVLDEKKLPTGELVGRARWVVCGNFEEHDSWAVQDVYAAVASTTSVKIFLLWTAILDLECYQFDIATAFLNADIPEGTNIYVMQPEGYEDGTSRVCLLKKALYGLRKSPLWWFKTITPVLQSLGFEPLDADLCLFKDEKRGCILILYVDDMLVAAPTKEIVFHVREQLQSFFEVKDLGEVKDFLGFTVIRDRPNKRIYLSQKNFTEKIISKYGYQKVNAATTPWPRGFELPTTWEPDKASQKSYIRQTGSLNFLSTGTRPDITYATNRLCEANAGPSDQHMQLLKHLFRYLIGTSSLSLCLGGKYTITNLPLLAFADAAFADRIPTRHSTAGYTILLAGCPILWKSSRQTIVALSTTEAEFMNLTPTGQALLWIHRIIQNLGVRSSKPVIIFTDSRNAQLTVLNPTNSARTRHIDTRYKWIIDRTTRGDFDIQHVSTNDMIADGLTKPLTQDRHVAFVRQLGLESPPVT